jgi:hypothetical protein
LYEIPADVTHVFGGYWDVYRIAFLSGGRIRGIPYPFYPNRFRGWSRGLARGQGKLLVLGADVDTRSRDSQFATRPAERRRLRPAATPSLADWRAALAIVWKKDGRDPAELYYLDVIVPTLQPARR